MATLDTEGWMEIIGFFRKNKGNRNNMPIKQRNNTNRVFIWAKMRKNDKQEKCIFMAWEMSA